MTDHRRSTEPPIVVTGGFEALLSSDVRFLDAASRLGPVHVRLWSDALVEKLTGAPPRFSQAERLFFAANLRYASSVAVIHSAAAATRTIRGLAPRAVVAPESDLGRLRAAADGDSIPCRAIAAEELIGWPAPLDSLVEPHDPDAFRVLVTGCFDWLHSGHVEFFREAATLGELYVVVGSDRNVRLLKGDGHPLHDETERAYMVGAARPVHRALISTGSGWMDAEPEVDTVKPHIYVVNEDGDKPEKREFCKTHGLDYVVLRRRPHRGLPRRTSTDLRGF